MYELKREYADNSPMAKEERMNRSHFFLPSEGPISANRVERAKQRLDKEFMDYVSSLSPGSLGNISQVRFEMLHFQSLMEWLKKQRYASVMDEQRMVRADIRRVAEID